MKLAILYHRIDCDGLASWAVVMYALHRKCHRDITSFPYTHGDPVPEGLDTFDKVYVVDISLPPTEMLRLYRMGKLVWIDHHKTSMDAAAQFGYDKAKGLRRIGVGACELCSEFLLRGSTPRFIALLSAYDVFDKKRFDWKKETLPFQYGVRNRFGLDRERFLDAIVGNIDLTYREILAEGQHIVDYVRQTGARACKAYGFDVKLAGSVPALCLLTGEFGSIPAEETARERGAQVIINANRLDADRYKISCFSPDEDSPISLGDYLQKTYGGGGHRNAAGAVVPLEVFTRLLTECVL